MKNLNKIKNIVLVVLVILLFLFVKNYFSKSNQLIESKGLLSSLNSELELTKDRLGNEVAKREVIETYNTKMFTTLQVQDSNLKELQNLVKENRKLLKKQGSATIIEGETKIDKSSVTNIYYKDSNVIYKSSFNDNWIDYSITAKKDSTELNLSVSNKYSVLLGSDKQGFLKKRKPYALVTNYNPYTKTKELRTYRVKVKPKRFSFGPQVGYGITKSGLSPYIGVGGSYKLIEF